MALRERKSFEKAYGKGHGVTFSQLIFVWIIWFVWVSVISNAWQVPIVNTLTIISLAGAVIYTFSFFTGFLGDFLGTLGNPSGFILGFIISIPFWWLLNVFTPTGVSAIEQTVTGNVLEYIIPVVWLTFLIQVIMIPLTEEKLRAIIMGLFGGLASKNKVNFFLPILVTAGFFALLHVGAATQLQQQGVANFGTLLWHQFVTGLILGTIMIFPFLGVSGAMGAHIAKNAIAYASPTQWFIIIAAMLLFNIPMLLRFFRKGQNLNIGMPSIVKLLCRRLHNIIMMRPNGKSLALVSFLSIIFLISPLAFGEIQNGKYTDSSGNIVNFKLDVTTSIRNPNSIIPSTSIVPIKITNPYAAAGQPVEIDLTVENLGADYPFNQIPLPPNQFALVVAVDKELGYAICPGNLTDENGYLVTFNYWDLMSDTEKQAFTLTGGMRALGSGVWDTIQGKTCSYVNIMKPDPSKSIKIMWWNWTTPEKGGIPQSVRQSMADYCNAEAQSIYAATGRFDLKSYNVKPADFSDNVYEWNCLKIVDQAYFEKDLKSMCPNGKLTQDCVQKINLGAINSNAVSAVASESRVYLVDTYKGKLPTGECRRGLLATECSIGDNGLEPGQKLTFKFFVLVPADAPVTPEGMPPALQLSPEGSMSGATTNAGTCIDQGIYSKGCHEIYVSVYPTPVKNLLSYGLDAAQLIWKFVDCSLTGLLQLSPSNIGKCIATNPDNVDIVGDPIAQGSGIFFVYGAKLGFSISMLLGASLITGFATALVSKK